LVFEVPAQKYRRRRRNRSCRLRDAKAFLHVVGSVGGGAQGGQAQGRTQGEDKGGGGQ
jgi:hypothetical protein